MTPEGNVTQISTSQPGTTTDATLYRISFLQNPEPAPGIKGGFDSPEERSYPGQNYPSREIQGENYPLAYKAVANGRLDHVLAQARKQGETQTETTFPEDVAFKTETSNAVSQALADSPYKKVQLLGLGHQQESDLIAYKRIQTTGDEGEEEREEILGAVRTISYNEQREKVVIVPVNGAQVPAGFTAQLQNQLNDIYGQSIAQWDVRIAQNLNYQPASPFDNGTTGALANYTPAMRQVKRAYSNQPGVRIDNDTYYIFIIPGETKDASKKAFMPRKRQSGFVYTANLPNNSTTEYWATVIAHELGHGAFRLEHHAGASSTTDNLMDYRMGRFLHQYQWNFIHNPVPMIALFQDDEEGAYGAQGLALVQWYEVDVCSDCLYVSFPKTSPFES